jgi:hypothetical protein
MDDLVTEMRSRLKVEIYEDKLSAVKIDRNETPPGGSPGQAQAPQGPR